MKPSDLILHNLVDLTIARSIGPSPSLRKLRFVDLQLPRPVKYNLFAGPVENRGLGSINHPGPGLEGPDLAMVGNYVSILKSGLPLDASQSS